MTITKKNTKNFAKSSVNNRKLMQTNFTTVKYVLKAKLKSLLNIKTKSFTNKPEKNLKQKV